MSLITVQNLANGCFRSQTSRSRGGGPPLSSTLNNQTGGFRYFNGFLHNFASMLGCSTCTIILSMLLSLCPWSGHAFVSSSPPSLSTIKPGAFVSIGCSRHAHAPRHCADTFEISNHFRQSFSPCLIDQMPKTLPTYLHLIFYSKLAICLVYEKGYQFFFFSGFEQ